jgi:serine/threonine protein kinase
LRRWEPVAWERFIWRAIPRLGRDVAVKVLPSRLCSDPNQRQRLEREARTISSLNHPNICQVHDVGCQDEIDFIVMEYVDGQTLAERLLSGPLPIKQALKIAIEIAEALDKGSCSRDHSSRFEVRQHHVNQVRGEQADGFWAGEADGFCLRNSLGETATRRRLRHLR